jgi:hypothetical protein
MLVELTKEDYNLIQLAIFQASERNFERYEKSKNERHLEMGKNYRSFYDKFKKLKIYEEE